MINKKIYIAGHCGMVGSAIWRALEAKGFENLIGKNFFNIQNEEKIIRCHVSNYDWLKKEEINKTNILEPLDIKYFSDDELLNSFNKNPLYKQN